MLIFFKIDLDVITFLEFTIVVMKIFPKRYEIKDFWGGIVIDGV